MRNIIWGAVIIAIGLIRGDSVFRGDFGILNVVFDALGVSLIIHGLFKRKQPPPVRSSQPR